MVGVYWYLFVRVIEGWVLLFKLINIIYILLEGFIVEGILFFLCMIVLILLVLSLILNVLGILNV